MFKITTSWKITRPRMVSTKRCRTFPSWVTPARRHSKFVTRLKGFPYFYRFVFTTTGKLISVSTERGWPNCWILSILEYKKIRRLNLSIWSTSYMRGKGCATDLCNRECKKLYSLNILAGLKKYPIIILFFIHFDFIVVTTRNCNIRCWMPNNFLNVLKRLWNEHEQLN